MSISLLSTYLSVCRIKSDSETSLDSETRIQKLCRRIQKLCVGFKNFLDGFRNFVFRNFFVGFRNSVRRIQKLFSSDSETFFIGFRIFVRRIQKLFSSDSETFFVGFRNSFCRIQKLYYIWIQKLFSTHAFNDYYIPFIKISPPPWQPNPCFQ